MEYVEVIALSTSYSREDPEEEGGGESHYVLVVAQKWSTG
jgi:hypothetical protein